MDHRTTHPNSATTEPTADDQPDTGQDATVPAPRAQSPSPTQGDGPPPDVAGPQPMVFSRSRLRAWRHLRRADYAALAHAAGITIDDVAAYEFGSHQPTASTISAWAGLLGCEPDQLRSTTPDGPDEYWQAANQAMGPMSADDLAAVADVIMRNHARRRQSPNRPTGRW